MAILLKATPHRCANLDCDVSKDRRCVEGFDELKTCPHYGKVALIIDAAKAEVAVAISRRVQLPGADALSTAAAQVLIRQRAANVIAIIGPHASGKTSLIGGVYDLLQHGEVGEFAFGGSTTLHAFERACHDARAVSKRSSPHMERTQTGEANYFHLDLVRTASRSKRAALLANRAGEDYMDTHSDPDLARKFPELRTADTLTLLADGEKLLDSGERHQVREDVCQSVRAFLEAEQTSKWQRLAIVLTKVDAVRSDTTNAERALKHFEGIVSDVRELFGTEFSEIEAFPVAASPKSSDAERGEGMEKLLAYWMAAPARAMAKIAPVAVAAERCFGRLQPLGTGGANG